MYSTWSNTLSTPVTLFNLTILSNLTTMSNLSTSITLSDNPYDQLVHLLNIWDLPRAEVLLWRISLRNCRPDSSTEIEDFPGTDPSIMEVNLPGMKIEFSSRFDNVNKASCKISSSKKFKVVKSEWKFFLNEWILDGTILWLYLFILLKSSDLWRYFAFSWFVQLYLLCNSANWPGEIKPLMQLYPRLMNYRHHYNYDHHCYY